MADAAISAAEEPSVDHGVPALRWQWRQVFPGEKRQLAMVRRWIESLLPPCTARDDLNSVATELASNAVMHTASGRGGWFGVEITLSRQVVSVAVTDHGAPSCPKVVDDPEAEHGRGLRVVAGLSIRSGVRGDERSRQVWADIAWDDDQAWQASTR